MLTVGIAGGTGSGKTTAVRKVMDAFPDGDVAVISQDSYYRDNASVPPHLRQKINFDHPRSVDFELLTSHLNRLKEGREIEMPQYSFINCLRSEVAVTVKPSQVILVEGILVLAKKDLRDLFDIKVFVDADADDRLGRVIRRDMQERGRDIRNILERYHDTVKPSHLEFIEPTKRYADIIIPGGGENSVGIGALISMIERYLNTGKL